MYGFQGKGFNFNEFKSGGLNTTATVNMGTISSLLSCFLFLIEDRNSLHALANMYGSHGC
jgi:hypothetical protein